MKSGRGLNSGAGVKHRHLLTGPALEELVIALNRLLVGAP
jgi:hypothetical protein